MEDKNLLEKAEQPFFIDGREYYFDFKRICEFLFSTVDKTEKEKEIVNTYELEDGEDSPKLSSKIIREVTSPTATQFETIKYDLLKTFIIQLITFSDKTNISDDSNNEIQIPIINIDFLPLGSRIVFNTLVEEKILIKKEDKNS